MAKKLVSVSLPPKKKPFKSTNKTKRLKNVLKNVLNYMKSDTYMFAPLISSDPYNPTTPIASFGGEISCENVKEYLKCDCYMYAPFIIDSSCDNPNPDQEDQCGEKAGKGCVGDHQMEPIMEETATQDGNTVREFENGDLGRRYIVKNNLLHRETVKHVVHQNRRSSSSVPGKVLSQKKAHTIVVE
ncbi:hypothetical protein CASFOL_013807 [Castilleja foliolosa]|uniref:Uncharacterized protein n=1 Tax=Castilleja foliolosa TaxID=1961234 RepID=A0ABD3DNY7_9LAMI